MGLEQTDRKNTRPEPRFSVYNNTAMASVVFRPNEGMRAAMAAAEVGDDVFRDDPTVLELGE